MQIEGIVTYYGQSIWHWQSRKIKISTTGMLKMRMINDDTSHFGSYRIQVSHVSVKQVS